MTNSSCGFSDTLDKGEQFIGHTNTRKHLSLCVQTFSSPTTQARGPGLGLSCVARAQRGSEMNTLSLTKLTAHRRPWAWVGGLPVGLRADKSHFKKPRRNLPQNTYGRPGHQLRGFAARQLGSEPLWRNGTGGASRAAAGPALHGCPGQRETETPTKAH